MENPFLARPPNAESIAAPAPPMRLASVPASKERQRRDSSGHRTASVISGSTTGRSDISRQTTFRVPPAVKPPTWVESQPQIEHEPSLVERIRGALPEIERLTSQYEEVCATLAMRDSHISHLERQKQDDNARLDRLGEELKSILDQNQAEKLDLSKQIEELQNIQGNLHRRLSREAGQRNALRVGFDQLNAESKSREEDHLREQEEVIRRHVGATKALQAQHDDEQQVLTDNFRSQNEVAEAKWSERLAEVSRSHREEQQRLETRIARDRRELEVSHARVCQNYETEMDDMMKTLEEERLEKKKIQQSWDRDRNGLLAQYSEQKAEWRKQAEEHSHNLQIKAHGEKEEALTALSETHTATLSSHQTKTRQLENLLVQESRQRLEAQNHLTRLQTNIAERDRPESRSGAPSSNPQSRQDMRPDSERLMSRRQSVSIRGDRAGSVGDTTWNDAPLRRYTSAEIARLREEAGNERRGSEEAEAAAVKVRRELEHSRATTIGDIGAVSKEVPGSRPMHKTTSHEGEPVMRPPDSASSSKNSKRMTWLH